MTIPQNAAQWRRHDTFHARTSRRTGQAARPCFKAHISFEPFEPLSWCSRKARAGWAAREEDSPFGEHLGFIVLLTLICL